MMPAIPIRLGARKAAAAAVITGTVLTAGVVSSAPAGAYVSSPPCYGPTCVGKSPYLTNRQGISCVADAVDLKPSMYVEGDASITVRWSAYCHANWVRWDTSMGYAPTYNQFYVQSHDGHRQYNGTGYYTAMANGTQTVLGCSYFPPPSSPGPACIGPF